MATGTPGTSARVDPRQVLNTWRQTVNYNDPAVAAGVLSGVWLPMGAFITQILVEIVTAFNAATTNVLTVGTNGTFDNIVGAGDVTEGTVAVTSVTTGLGRSIAAAGDAQIGWKYTQTGTAATAGQAVIVICFEGNFPG